MQTETRFQIIFASICIFRFLTSSVHCYRFEPNTMQLTNYSECPGNEKYIVHPNYTITQVARNRYVMNGEIIFDEYLAGQMEVQITSKRCDFNMTKCEVFDSMNIKDVCRLMDVKDQLWTEFFEHSEPRIRCPFKKTSIKITEGIIDMGYVAHFPLSGYKWNFDIKVFKSGDGAKGRHKKRLLMCLMYELNVTKTRPERKKTTTTKLSLKN